jgi:hypothetical protein
MSKVKTIGCKPVTGCNRQILPVTGSVTEKTLIYYIYILYCNHVTIKREIGDRLKAYRFLPILVLIN